MSYLINLTTLVHIPCHETQEPPLGCVRVRSSWDGWIRHYGAECSTPPDQLVELMYKEGPRARGAAGELRWEGVTYYRLMEGVPEKKASDIPADDVLKRASTITDLVLYEWGGRLFVCDQSTEVWDPREKDADCFRLLADAYKFFQTHVTVQSLIAKAAMESVLAQGTPQGRRKAVVEFAAFLSFPAVEDAPRASLKLSVEEVEYILDQFGEGIVGDLTVHERDLRGLCQ